MALLPCITVTKEHIHLLEVSSGRKRWSSPTNLRAHGFEECVGNTGVVMESETDDGSMGLAGMYSSLQSIVQSTVQ